jgi:aldose 1-epimerase
MAAALYRRDVEGIPTGELVAVPPGPWDDCFPRPDSPIAVRWPGALAVTLDTDCPDVVVFSERPNAVCVEPQTGPPDAVNLGINCTVLGPGDTLTAWARWTWRDLD